MKDLCALLLVWMVSFPVLAQEPYARGMIEEFPEYVLHAGETDADELPTSGAKLCWTWQGEGCYTMPSSKPDSATGVTYNFGGNPRAERIPLKGGGSLVLFSAEFSGGGSGTLDRAALLEFRKGVGVINLLPTIALTNVSQMEMWTLPAISAMPVLVTADFVWGKGEDHFGRHFYDVSAYEFEATGHGYVRVVNYKTAKKYEGGDAGPVEVLEPERADIERRLEAAQKH